MARRSQVGSSGYTILVVDDQEEMRASLRNLLEREGHRVLTAESGERALALFKENEVHLLFVDYLMPRMTGDQLVREIRKFDPYVQIVMQTGWSGEVSPRQMLNDLDIQGYHDKADGPEKLLLWVQVGLKAYRAIRALRDRERREAELVANVSHELKNPISIISGYAELLREGDFGDLPQRSLKPLRALAGTTKMLNELVQNFLDYARVEAGALGVETQEVSLQEIVEEMTALATFLLQDRDVQLEADPPILTTRVICDVPKLRTILRNLVTNAAKFTQRGRIGLHVDLRRDHLQVAVHDTGVGIALEDQESIFEPFRQLDGSLTRSFGGIGLGLALSRKLARALGGDVAVESEPGVGSTFTLTVPVRRPVVERAPASARLHTTELAA
jgi:signal transduction histidine kinase